MTAIAKDAPILVAGARGMVGSALVRRLQAGGYTQVLAPGRTELDLTDTAAVQAYLAQHRPAYIFIAAAKVGGIHANNTYRAEFLHTNLTIQNNLIHGAHLAGVQRLMFLGSSCIYPKMAPQPIKEEYLLTGPLEPTNEPYAIAKIAGIKMCEAYNAQYGRQYISVMPTNLYGPNDNYDLNNSHVLPALIRKAHEAKLRGDAQYVVWGSGTPRREFLYVDDLADACVFLMECGYDGPLLNIGTGEDVTIRELAETVMKVVGFEGQIVFDASKPDGTPRKLLDVSRLAAQGWLASTSLKTGIELAYRDFLATMAAPTDRAPNAARVIRRAMLASAGLIGTAISTWALRPSQAKLGTHPALVSVMPTSFGNWRLLPEAPGTAVVTAYTQELLAKTYDDLFTGSYIDSVGQRVMVSIAYGQSQTRDLQVHKPEVCYVAQGFQLTSLQRGALTFGQAKLPVTRMVAKAGQRIEPVTYWIRVGSAIVQGWYQQNLARITQSMHGSFPDGLLFRVSTIDPDAIKAFEVQEAFIDALLQAIASKDRAFLIGSP